MTSAVNPFKSGFNTRRLLEKFLLGWLSDWMVEHSTNNPIIKGLNPPGNGKEDNAKSFF